MDNNQNSNNSSENSKNSEIAKVISESVSQSNPNKKIFFALTQDAGEKLEKSGYAPSDVGSLTYALQLASGSASKKAPALAFTEAPQYIDSLLGMYKSKRRLLPDEVIKTISTQDHLIASILRTRGNMLSLYGHLRKDRFDVGIEVAIKPDFFKILTPEQYEKIVVRMKRLEQLVLNCGHTEGLELQERMTLADFLDIQTRNALRFGRNSTEIIYDRSVEPDEGGNYPFFRFRPVDVATIVRAVRRGERIGNNLRLTALHALESLTGEKFNIDFEQLKEDKYAWLQVIDGTPRQAFTHDEMVVLDFFPSTDIEHNGYPVSPLDTIVSSVTTHISIDTYHKLYFQYGRASKGILTIKSDEADQQMLDNLRLQFQASINSVSNSFRSPIFAIGKEDDVSWLPMTGEGMMDSNFPFMYDQVARNILAAFGISPDELPAYGHLSRGTTSQSLSESNNEYRLTAARDSGLRPLILKWQNFFNQRFLPIIDPLLSKVCEIRFCGLDTQSKEQESARLQQDSAIHLTYDEILHQVDKDPVGPLMGGSFPFNERLQLVLDKYVDVGKISSHFFNNPASSVDPLLKYKRDPFAIQFMQLLSDVNPLAVKAFFAPKPFSIEFLKMDLQDMLEEDN